MGDVGSQRRSGRASSGYRAARVRESQFLPLDWRHLTENEIQQLHGEVTRLLKGDADLLTVETCLLAWSILTTGRLAAQLLPLSVRVITRRDAFDEREHGLFKVDGCWGWWLGCGRAGAAERVQGSTRGTTLVAVGIPSRHGRRRSPHRPMRTDPQSSRSRAAERQRTTRRAVHPRCRDIRGAATVDAR